MCYSTAQLQGNVRTRFRSVSHAFQTHPCLTKKGRGTHVHLVAALSRGFALAWTCLACVPDASCTRFRRVRMLPWSWAVLYSQTEPGSSSLHKDPQVILQLENSCFAIYCCESAQRVAALLTHNQSPILILTNSSVFYEIIDLLALFIQLYLIKHFMLDFF